MDIGNNGSKISFGFKNGKNLAGKINWPEMAREINAGRVQRRVRYAGSSKFIMLFWGRGQSSEVVYTEAIKKFV